MNKYNSLLLRVANKYYILKGDTESEEDWKTRLIYSICGLMAYACLWDDCDESISIIHLKKRIQNIYTCYKLLYSELSSRFTLVPEELESEIVDQFLKSGIVYHSPKHVAPSQKHEELFEGILFQRGISIDSISRVSGIGFFSSKSGSGNLSAIKKMFGLEQYNLLSLWQSLISNVIWKPNLLFEDKVEYLRMKPPFSKGYWTTIPDNSGRISILRCGTDGVMLYYLYRYVNDGTVEVSALPDWRVTNYNYRSIACACLSTYGVLPSIEYIEDGELVHIYLNYLLPPRELNFLKLYSWPERFTVVPCDFRRKLTVHIFRALKSILSEEGYTFKRRT